MFSPNHSIFHPVSHRRREYGFDKVIGSGDGTAKSLYTGMKAVHSWDCEQTGVLPTGGVFNLEFSPEGSLLVAACEKKCIQVFDPLNYKRIHVVDGAHNDCVNCVKFLDNRVFATCSDDTTIGLWDIRNLKRKILTLHGHSSWVKNIEFSSRNNLLVTSGLDGSIYTWDINSYTESSLLYSRIFNAPDLMRCRLTPDSHQMVMCTTGGLLIIVHDLDLAKLHNDLSGFKPNLYRLMQTANQNFPVASDYANLFNRRRSRNRLEFISDFPLGNDAAVVSSLQIHPQGWTALSRNISHDDKSEWTCIHNIQADCSSDTEEPSDVPIRKKVRRHRQVPAVYGHVRTYDTHNDNASRSGSSRNPGGRRPRTPQEPEPGAQIQNDVWEAWVTVRQSRLLQAVVNRGQTPRSFNMQHITGINTGITSSPPWVTENSSQTGDDEDYIDEVPRASQENRPSTSGQTADVIVEMHSQPIDYRKQMLQNKERLLYFIEETNEGKGFIKELCYSADGRVICSPFGHGIRLLAHNSECMELSHCVDEKKDPQQLLEVGQSIGIHRDLVVSAKFSPRHHQLVTGCLAGKIVWYIPHSGESLM